MNSRDKQSEMRSSRSLGDLKGSLLKGSERVRKHSTGELAHGTVVSIWKADKTVNSHVFLLWLLSAAFKAYLQEIRRGMLMAT